jgi:NhaA family Na+:H+ antiporter
MPILMIKQIRVRLSRRVLEPALETAAVPLSLIRDFLRLEASGGLVLMGAAALAIICASTSLAHWYESFREIPVVVTIGGFGVSKDLVHWVNDGLMALFFFLVGLEIKRETVRGELSSLKRAMLPAIAAVAGMVVPAMIYLSIAAGHGEAIRGWAIAGATDIAFALGIMALLGSRVPPSLKVLMTAIAVIDDLGAIAIIAIFYTSDLSWLSLAVAGAALFVLLILNLSGVKRIAPYVLVGFICWIAVLKSGVHATMAGVLTAMAIPIDGNAGEGGEPQQGPLEHLEHILLPWIAFAVLPLFGFLNAGVSLAHLDLAALATPITLGIAAGLFLGKQLGVFSAIFLAVKTGIASKPRGASWLQVYGLSILAGIGFTMSLFIGELAFTTGTHDAELRLGVLGGSVLSAIIGYALLRFCAPKPADIPHTDETPEEAGAASSG